MARNAGIVAALVALCVAAAQAEGWSYEGDNGPSHWNDTYPTCGGQKQSPIDIKEDQAEYSADLTSFTLTGYDKTAGPLFLLKNTGHSVQVDVSGTDTYDATGGGLAANFRLGQFHFHWGSINEQGSEHELDGARYPMEMHFVHFNSDMYDNVSMAADKPGGLAVFGFFFEIGAENPALKNVVDNLGSVMYSGQNKTIPTFSLLSLMSDRSEYFRYDGSLTTPACYESVTWTLFVDTIKLSQAQLDEFRKVYESAMGATESEPMVDNYRPVQDLNGRKVYSNYHSSGADRTVSYGSLTLLATTMALLRVF